MSVKRPQVRRFHSFFDDDYDFDHLIPRDPAPAFYISLDNTSPDRQLLWRRKEAVLRFLNTCVPLGSLAFVHHFGVVVDDDIWPRGGVGKLRFSGDIESLAWKTHYIGSKEYLGFDQLTAHSHFSCSGVLKRVAERLRSVTRPIYTLVFSEGFGPHAAEKKSWDEVPFLSRRVFTLSCSRIRNCNTLHRLVSDPKQDSFVVDTPKAMQQAYASIVRHYASPPTDVTEAEGEPLLRLTA